MTLTKIKKDEMGLFVRCDGCIARYTDDAQIAIYGKTKFKERQEVSCTHPAGATVFVKSKPNRKEKPECWEIEQ